MKNIYLLPTDKPSRIYTCGSALYMNKLALEHNTNQNIYITSDEEIKEGDWLLNLNGIFKVKPNYINCNPTYKKIILTTDTDLIKDGVQSIDDEFLEWFVNNSSFEEIEVIKMLQKRWGTDWQDLPNQTVGREIDGIYRYVHKTAIPKEDFNDYHYKETFESRQYYIPQVEPKQEEKINELQGSVMNLSGAISSSFSIQKEQKPYNEEELLAFGKSCFYKGFEKSEKDDANCYTAFREEIGVLFELFKNK